MVMIELRCNSECTNDSNSWIVRSLWTFIEAKNWDNASTLLSIDFYAYFPQSGERFSRADYIRLNAEYPGDWQLCLRELFCAGEWIITEVDVIINNRVDTGISFFRLADGLIIELKEYWPESFSIPAWRLEWGNTND